MNQKTRYWFPAKRYGWGWGPPQTWQGWAVFLVWLAAIPIAALRLMPHHRVGFVIFVFAMVVLLLVICYAKGEPPGWRWGNRD